MFGELGSKKRVGFSVRGGQPAGTERQRKRGPFYSISRRDRRQRPNIGIPLGLKDGLGDKVHRHHNGDDHLDETSKV